MSGVWLGSFVGALAVFIVVMAGLSVGLVLGRAPPAGSCGGVCAGCARRRGAKGCTLKEGEE